MAFDYFSTHLFHHDNHFRVEVANPIHLIVVVSLVFILKYFPGFHDHSTVQSFALVFRNNAEKDSKSLSVGL